MRRLFNNWFVDFVFVVALVLSGIVVGLRYSQNGQAPDATPEELSTEDAMK